MNALLRHGLATVAYRGGKVLRDIPPGFATFDAGAGTRTPVEILAHMGDLYDWALTFVDGDVKWVEHPSRDWDLLVGRFFDSLAAFDRRIALVELPMDVAESALRGPVADSLTHIGQIALLRRLAGAAVRGENYARAGITTGRVGRDQPVPVREF